MGRFRLGANSSGSPYCWMHNSLRGNIDLEVKHSFTDEFDFKLADVPSNENIYWLITTK